MLSRERYMIKLYSTNCPKCKALEMKMGKKGIEYEVHTDMEEMKRLKFAAAPILEVDGQYLDFSKAIKWINAQ